MCLAQLWQGNVVENNVPSRGLTPDRAQDSKSRDAARSHPEAAARTSVEDSLACASRATT
jgi:hypothetical protein